MPLGFTRIQQGDVIRAGGRDWDIHIGNGHAPEHATLWSRDCDLVLAGDQILPSISSNLGGFMPPSLRRIRSENGLNLVTPSEIGAA